jgi:hypothetical protein
MEKDLDFKTTDNHVLYASYISGILSLIALVFGIIILVQTNQDISTLSDDVVTDNLTADKISAVLSLYSMQLSLAFGSIGISGILSGTTGWLASSWYSGNVTRITLKAQHEYTMGILKGMQILETKLNKLLSQKKK